MDGSSDITIVRLFSQNLTQQGVPSRSLTLYAHCFAELWMWTELWLAQMCDIGHTIQKENPP